MGNRDSRRLRRSRPSFRYHFRCRSWHCRHLRRHHGPGSPRDRDGLAPHPARVHRRCFPCTRAHTAEERLRRSNRGVGTMTKTHTALPDVPFSRNGNRSSADFEKPESAGHSS
jgi:hypothetical protein